MKEETLKKANELTNALKRYEKNLQNIGYTQSEDRVIRESYLNFNGIEDTVTVPASLFRTIGKLIQSEYIFEINKIKDQLDKL